MHSRLIPLASLLLGLAIAPPAPAQARRGGAARFPARTQKPAKQSKTPIDEFQNMSPEERQKQLESLPPEQRKKLEERLRKFDQLPPAQQQTLKNMYTRLNQLPPERQTAVRKALNKFSEEPPDRQQAMRDELKGMASLPEQDRQARMSSPDFRSRFNGKEQGIVRDMSALLPARD